MFVALWFACAEEPAPGPVPTPTAPCEGTFGVVAGVHGVMGRNDDGRRATDTWLSLPQDVTPGPDGTFWVVDYNNHLIREVDAHGISRVVVGSGFPGGGNGGPALEEPLDHPTMVVPDPEDPDVLWFAATGNHRIGRVDLVDGAVTFPYGAGFSGYTGDGGPASQAWFHRPSSLAFDEDGVMYVSDRMNQIVRAIPPDGTVRTVVGTPEVPGYTGDGGPAEDATLAAFGESDPANRLEIRGDRLVLADTGNHVLREVDLATGRIRTLAGTGVPGHVDGAGDVAQFAGPRDVAIAPDGTVYVADADNAAIRAVAPDGEVTTIGGTPWPAGIAVGEDGTVWVADRNDGVILRSCEPMPR